MGQRPRAQPKLLPLKLLQIRQRLVISQCQMAQLLNLKPKHGTSRVHEFETGKREPNLMILLKYSRLARIPVEYLIDDDLDLDDAYN
jgi:transcriptional regulator with XRE-family HTH domain